VSTSCMKGGFLIAIIQSVVIRSGMVSCCFRSTVTSEFNRVATNMG